MFNIKVFLYIVKVTKRWDIIDRYILKHRTEKSFTKQEYYNVFIVKIQE